MKENFNNWLKTMKESVATYKYYIDFETVYNNVRKYEVQLQKLNCLIGNNNIEEDFKTLVLNDNTILEVIPTLLAKRESEIICFDYKGSVKYNFDYLKQTVEQYAYFMKETGLFDLLQNKLINNLVDYAIGVETGLNTNARKNRGGHIMEDIVEEYIQKAGFIKNKNYYKELYASDIEKMMNIDLSAITNNGTTEKRFDYVILKNNIIYALECNFYNSSGSKLNETARSYKQLAEESKNIPNFEFVWITDGIKGWQAARNNLYETYEVLDKMYNLADLEKGALINL